MTRGIVVDHKESNVRYAISEKNFNPELHRKVRDLKPGESVLSYRPRAKGSRASQESLEGLETPKGKPEAAGDLVVGSGDQGTDTQTEGATNGTQEKEGK